MTVYFVIGAVLVAWALVLTFGGMTRAPNFPDVRSGRMLMAVSAGLALAAFAAVVTTTEKEHPRIEAKEKQEKSAESGRDEGAAGGTAGSTFRSSVAENEYSIKLNNSSLRPGGIAFEVENKGKIPHDLAIEGNGVERKTPLIDPGKNATVEADLKPGTYKLYCTVPGHEQLGMKTEVTVR
jgi:uncharacterized cupredoxin-like copper-binding protein